VGAGPAGLAAARECSRAGTDVLLIEKDDILEPKKSLEIPYSVVDEFMLQECVVNVIKKERYLFPEKRQLDITSETPRKAILDQKIFSERFSRNIKYIDKTKVVGAKRNEKKVILLTSDRKEIEGNIIIDATGYSANISQMLGKHVKMRLSHISGGFLARGDVTEFGIDDETIQRFDFVADTSFGRRITEMWIYPFSENLFDIGWGYYLLKEDVKTVQSDYERYMNELYLKLFDLVKQNFGVEFSKPLRKYHGLGNSNIMHNPCDDNLLVTGEAMGMVQPFYYRGFETSLLQGRIAGAVASQAAQERDFSRKYLKKYESLISKNERIGYLWANMGKELAGLFPSVLGDCGMNGIYKIFRYLVDKDIEKFYNFIEQRKLPLDDIIPIGYTFFKEETKGILKMIKEGKSGAAVNNLIQYFESRFL